MQTQRNALERGRACVLRGDRDGAQRAFEEASNDPAQAIDARLELANLFSAAGNSAAARPLLDELLASLVPACSNRVLVVAGSGYSGVGPAQGGKGAGAFEEIGRAELSVALEQFPA